MFPQNSQIDTIYLSSIFFVFLFAICLVKGTGGAVNSEKFNKLDGYRIIDIIETINCSTKLQCCSQCLKEAGCVSVNFRQNSQHLNCDLNCKTPLDADVSIEKVDHSNVFYIDNDPWKLVFRLTTGKTTNPYHAWKNGTGTDNSDDCKMLYPPMCTSYYRHNLLDIWQNWSIKQVKLAVYKDHTLVAYIVFNGTESDMESWFSKRRLVQTSWTDLVATAQASFSLKGDDVIGRCFLIHGPYASCSTDYGWILVSSGITPICSFDQHASYPSIIYARNGTNATYASQGYGAADVLAIYIKET